MPCSGPHNLAGVTTPVTCLCRDTGIEDNVIGFEIPLDGGSKGSRGLWKCYC